MSVHAVGVTRAEALARSGYLVCRSVVPGPVIEAARVATEGVDAAGIREPLGRWAALDAVAHDPTLRALAAEVGLAGAMIVRSILFDKTPDRNWPVAPHQDTTIAVAGRVDMPGFGPWSRKHGADHVQPPTSVLASMVTIRVHLDAAGTDNGALRVVPGSHRRGVLGPAEISELAARGPWEDCVAEPGDVVLMAPLTVHASSRAGRPSRRRVLHLELAAAPLPEPLRWRWVTRL